MPSPSGSPRRPFLRAQPTRRPFPETLPATRGAGPGPRPRLRGGAVREGGDQPAPRARAPSSEPRVTAPTWRRPGLPARPQRRERAEVRRAALPPGRGHEWAWGSGVISFLLALPRGRVSALPLTARFFSLSPAFSIAPFSPLPCCPSPCPLPLSFVSLLLSVFFSHLSHLFLSIVVLPVCPVLPFLSPSFSLSSSLLPLFRPPSRIPPWIFFFLSLLG